MKGRVIENEVLRVSVADAGAELVSVVDRQTKHEYIWNADPAVWNRHAPILFPFVGKSSGGGYRYEENFYPMGQHGFARDMEFVCVECEATSVTYGLRADEKTMALYPFDFELRVTHKLDETNPRLLHVCWDVRNHGEGEMYYSIGGHPGFVVPAKEGESRADYYLEFPGKEDISYSMINLENGLIYADRKSELSLDHGFAPIKTDLFDMDALVFEDYAVEKVRIAKPDKTPYVTMYSEGFPYFGIWSKPEGKFVCLEPWVGRADDDGFAGELPEKTGVQCLAAGERRIIAYSVEFHA